MSFSRRVLEWDDLKPVNMYAECSNNPVDMAGHRAKLRYNLRLHCQEMLISPDRYFHPIWYNLREDKQVDRHMRSVIEQQMLNDILDAITIHDVYTGSVSAFFSHNGHLPPGTISSSQTISPVSYVTPRVLLYRNNTEPPQSVPFAVMLQIFIDTFAIPHVQLYEKTSHSIGYLAESVRRQDPPMSPSTIRGRRWPTLENYTTEVSFRLPGWRISEIPQNVTLLLRQIFPMFVGSTPDMPVPSPPPKSTVSSQFNLTHSMSQLSVDEDVFSAPSSTSQPTSSRTSHSGRQVFVSEDEDCYKKKITMLEEEIMQLKQSLRKAEDLLHRDLHSSEMEDASQAFGPRTAAFLNNRGLPVETHSIFWELTRICPNQEQWRSLLNDLFELTEEEVEILVSALHYDFALNRLKMVSSPLGGVQALKKLNRSHAT